MNRTRIAVIGAGPAGMTAAYELAKSGVEVHVFEAEDRVGGLCRTIPLWGQMVDLGPHRFFSSDPRVNQVWQEVVGEDYRLVNRLTRIYYNRRFFHYPLQPFNALWNMGFWEAGRCLASYLSARMEQRGDADDDPTFESWVVGRFGRRLYEMFFKSYTEKLWGVPCDQLDADFARQRIKKFSMGEAIKSAFHLGKSCHATLVDCFGYPTFGTGGVYERMADFVCGAGGRVHLGRPVDRILHQNRRVYGVQLADGEQFPCQHVISTMPFTLMVKGLGRLPADVQQSLAELTYRNTILVYLKVSGTESFPDQWLYVHAPELLMGRVSNFRNWVPELYGESPASILSLEYWCYDDDPLWNAPDAQLVDLATSEIGETGLIAGHEVQAGEVVRLHRSYPVYGRNYKNHVDTVVQFLDRFTNLTAIGRCGAFKYNNQDHSILMGLLAAENLLRGRKHNLWAINTDYQTYQESAKSDGLRKAA